METIRVKVFEDKPRYKGCPPICLRTNLPSFPSPDSAREFHEATNPRGHMEDPWPCPFCKHWHYNTVWHKG